jgi:hypothetical protein
MVMLLQAGGGRARGDMGSKRVNACSIGGKGTVIIVSEHMEVGRRYTFIKAY